MHLLWKIWIRPVYTPCSKLWKDFGHLKFYYNLKMHFCGKFPTACLYPLLKIMERFCTFEILLQFENAFIVENLDTACLYPLLKIMERFWTFEILLQFENAFLWKISNSLSIPPAPNYVKILDI